MTRRLLGTAGATAALLVLGAGPAVADNCGSLFDCLPGAKGLLVALAAVLIVAGIAAIFVGGGALLAALLGGAGFGGGLAFAGGGVLSGAGAISATAAAELAAAGAVATTTGVMMAEAAGSMGSGSSSGSGASGGSGSGGGPRSSSPNQMQQQVGRGQAPRSVDRVDNGRQLPNGRWEEPHVHFRDGAALYRDGVWRHGGRELSNAEITWLTNNGWRVPGG